MKNEEHWQFRKPRKEQAPASREQKLHIVSKAHPIASPAPLWERGWGVGWETPPVRQTSWREAGAQDADL